MKEEKNSGNQSLIRGLRLIDLLSHYPNGCPLAKLAELSGLNKSITRFTTGRIYSSRNDCWQLSTYHKMFSYWA